jgi:hypothetical protein
MNKELSILLLNRVKDAPYLDRTSGMVQVFERSIENEAGGTTVKKIPVTSSATFQDCGRKLADMIPNSKCKGMLYFEDGGISSPTPVRAGMQYTSRLRLVCWLNTERITGAANMQLTARAVTDLITRLTGNPFNCAPFSRVTVKVDAIPVQDKAIFNKYDYSEADLQYLMSPYEYFGIDLQVTYYVANTCIENITPIK